MVAKRISSQLNLSKRVKTLEKHKYKAFSANLE